MQRLKSRAQFQAVLAGTLVAKTAHFALHRCPIDVAPVAQFQGQPVPLFPVRSAWLGAMVPKRWAKRAVTRNTIKRQIYAVSASQSSAFAESAYVVRLRSGFERSQFLSASSPLLKAAVRQELLQLLAPKASQP